MPRTKTKPKKTKRFSGLRKLLFTKRIGLFALIFAIIGVVTLHLSFAAEGSTLLFNSPGIEHSNGWGDWVNGVPLTWYTGVDDNSFAWFGPHENRTITAPSGGKVMACYYFNNWRAQQIIYVDIVAGANHHTIVSTSFPGSSLGDSSKHYGYQCISGLLPKGTTTNLEYRIKVTYSAGIIVGILSVGRSFQ